VLPAAVNAMREDADTERPPTNTIRIRP
jgi:hypothetical protein